MALLEAEVGRDGIDIPSAANVLGAIVNRSEADRMPLEKSVSSDIYQPTIEDRQRKRLSEIVKNPAFNQLTDLAERRVRGDVGDWVGGATHYLTPERTMLDLYQKNPDKYHNWGPFQNSKGVPGRNWTGYNPDTGSYDGVVMRDRSHAFLRPGATTQSQPPEEKKQMLDIASLLRSFGASGNMANLGGALGKQAGIAGAAIPKMASAADPGTSLQNLFGSLSNFAPGSQNQGQGQASNADSYLAKQAMANASAPASAAPQMQMRQPDMQRLSQILQQTGRLGSYRMRGMG